MNKTKLADAIARELRLHTNGSWREICKVYWSEKSADAIMIRDDALELVLRRIIAKHLDPNELDADERALVEKPKAQTRQAIIGRDEFVVALTGDAFGLTQSEAKRWAQQIPDGSLEERLTQYMKENRNV